MSSVLGGNERLGDAVHAVETGDGKSLGDGTSLLGVPVEGGVGGAGLSAKDEGSVPARVRKGKGLDVVDVSLDDHESLAGRNAVKKGLDVHGRERFVLGRLVAVPGVDKVAGALDLLVVDLAEVVSETKERHKVDEVL